MVDNRKNVLKRNDNGRNRIRKKYSYLDRMAEWNIKWILIALAFGLIFIILPIYMFSAEPYDIESSEATPIHMEGADEDIRLANDNNIKEILDNTNPIDGEENEMEINAIANSISVENLSDKKIDNELSKSGINPVKPNTDSFESRGNEGEISAVEKSSLAEDLSDKKIIENELFKPDINAVKPNTDYFENHGSEVEISAVEKSVSVEDLSDKKIENELPKLDINSISTNKDNSDQLSEEIRAEAIEMLDEGNNERTLSREEVMEMLAEGKSEKELSYDELSEAIKAERLAKSELKNEDSIVDIDDEEFEEELENGIPPDNNMKYNETKQSETIDNGIEEKKEKVLPSVKSSEFPEVKRLSEPELGSTNSVAVEDIKLEENKKIVSDNNSNINIKKEADQVIKTKNPLKKATKNIISRAFLSRKLENKEPVGYIKSPVIVNNKVMTKIYYFTEILNMEGEVLYHYWMWDGKIEFEKEIKIWGNRWRASTLKMIPYSKTGKWQARIVNEVGDILNEIEFNVIKE